MTSRPSDEPALFAAIQEKFRCICLEWGFVRPKVHISYRYEKFTYHVRIVFEQRWVIDFELDANATKVSELCMELFDDMGEDWAQDANIPITGEAECQNLT